MKRCLLIVTVTVLSAITTSYAGTVDQTPRPRKTRHYAEPTVRSGDYLAGVSDKGLRIQRLEHIRFAIRRWGKWERLPVGTEKSVLNGIST